MRSDLVAPVPKRRAVDAATRMEIAGAFVLDARFSVSLPAIIAGLAGAALIVYVAERFGSPSRPELAQAGAPDAIEAAGVSLVK